MKVTRLLKYLVIPVYRPNKRIGQLINDSDRLAYGIIALLMIGLLYTFTILIGYINGFGAAFPPVLNIPAEEYYFWEIFFAMPVFILAVILYAGTARLVASALGGKGSFEAHFAVLSVAILIPTLLTMWLPETLLFAFFPETQKLIARGEPVFHPVFDIPRQVIGILWPLALATLGIRRSEKVSWPAGVLTSLCAMVVYLAFILVFIR
jgi:hypothetical protein